MAYVIFNRRSLLYAKPAQDANVDRGGFMQIIV